MALLSNQSSEQNMAEGARESERNDEDITTNIMSTEFTSSESEFSAVTFNYVSECYPPDRDIECRYTIESSIKPSSWDYIGLFKVGWQSSREHYTYEWSPMPSIQGGEPGRQIANRVVFRLRYLPKADDEFYQFCYVTYAGDVRGASVPFQIKTKPTEQDELECYEIEDDDGSPIVIVKSKTAMLEESHARVLEENACLKASNETALADLANANDRVMESELRKADLMAGLNESENKVSNLEQTLAQKNLALEEQQGKIRYLESASSDLKAMQEDLNERVERNMEKLATERKQYLENMAADRQMIEKLQNELKAKEDEINTLKTHWAESETKARSKSTEFAEKIEKANSEIGILQEQLVQITEENNILKRNLEEESERLAKKVQDLYIELKNKDQELEKGKEEIASYRCRILKVESSEAEILRDAERLGLRIEELQRASNKKQELIHQLEQELEDANIQLEQERGKITALEEDFKSKIRSLHNQLEGERALNHSLCSQAEHDISDHQVQVQKQQEANMELNQQLERQNAELSDLCGERDNFQKQLQSTEEKLQAYVAQLTAVDAEVELLKVEKENLQKTLTDTQEASAQSAASRYALQTAYAHIEKKYLQMKKQMEELWTERSKLKRTITTFHGNVSCDNLCLLTAVDAEVELLMIEKENLQKTLTDTQEASAKSTASRYALQTAYAHIEKKYLQMKKQMEELWRERRNIHCNVPCDNLCLRMEEMRACNEDLRLQLNIATEAFKMKFIECRQLEEQLKKVARTSSEHSKEAGSTSEMRNKVSKLQMSLEEEKKALNVENKLVLHKGDEVYQVICHKLELVFLMET